MPKSRSRSNRKPAYTPPPSSTATKPNPRWFLPVMITCFIVGLLWIVVTYMSENRYPVPAFGAWNLAVGFAFVLIGFGMTTRWR